MRKIVHFGALVGTFVLLLLVACVASGAGNSTAGRAPSPRLGMTFQEAGVDSGTVGSNGLLNFTLATPVTPPFGDPVVTAVEVRDIHMDLVAGTVIVTYGIAADITPTPRQRVLMIQLNATQESTFTNAIKSAIAAQIGTTFQ